MLEPVQVEVGPMSDWSGVVLIFCGGCATIPAVIALGFYAVTKMRPDSFRARTTVLRIFWFSIEIESPGVAEKLPGSVEKNRGLADDELKITYRTAAGTLSV